MTRRERLERKVEKREGWAEKRRDKVAQVYRFTEQFRGDHAFNTQPGHIPLRARVIRMEERAHGDLTMAEHHENKAAGLADQLDRAVFSDDANAVEALEARISEHETKRERMKLVNKLYKQGDAAGLAALGLDLDRLRAKLSEAGPYWGKAPHLPYELSNLGGRITTDRQRLAAIKAQQGRAEQATAATNGVLIEGETYVRVTFAEKPDRATLDDLKAAGFRWGSGSWVGERAKLPAQIAGRA